MFQLIVISITAAANLLLGLIVILKNPKSYTSRFFLFLTYTFVLWSIIDYLSVHPVVIPQLELVRLVLFCGGLLNLGVFLTFLSFPNPNLSKKYKNIAELAVLVTILIIPLTLTSLVFKRLNIHNGKAEPVVNIGIGLFALHTVGFISASIYLIIKKYRHAKGIAKDQLRYVLFGIVGTFGLIVITNFLLVVIFGFTTLVPLGPAFTLILSGSLAYAIVKHRLFDISTAIARGLVYVLSLVSIGLIYGGIVYIISLTFNYGDNLNNGLRIFYVALALITALIFPRIKAFFDSVTRRVFFRNSYNSQELIDRLNKVFVSEVDFIPMLRRCIEVFEQYLKSNFISFAIEPTTYNDMRIIGPLHSKLDVDKVSKIKKFLDSVPGVVILTDYLDENHFELKELLTQYDIAALVRIGNKQGKASATIGYIMLGSRKSGDVYTQQDVEVLNIVANELVIALQNSLRFEEIQQFNVTLQQKVNEATLKLRRANEKLRALDETKDDFISMASHQLRTPLTSVKGYLSMVLDGDAGKVSKTQKDMLGQAFFSSQRMVYLIADLLNVSRLKTGKFVIEPSPVNLSELVSQELSQLEETASSKSLKLTYDKPKDFPSLMLDETKTRQVIMNFVDNAIYYTPSGGQINVKLIDNPQTIELRVEDNGIGVPKAEQHHLFTKFYRAGNARKARPDGTGLGLFMAKKVVVAEGGSIVFDSQEGKGSTFGFTFSKTKLEPKPGTQIPAKEAEQPEAKELTAVSP